MLLPRKCLAFFLLVGTFCVVTADPCFFWKESQYFDQHCYKMVGVSVNWTTAKDMCEVYFGQLASPTATSETSSFLVDLVTFSTTEVDWWVGSSVSDDDTGGSLCSGIEGTKNLTNLPFYRNVSCALRRSFICQKYVGGPCDDAFQGGVSYYYYMFCYTFTTTLVHWRANNNPCPSGQFAAPKQPDIYRFFQKPLLELVETKITTPVDEWIFPEDKGVGLDGAAGISFYVLTYGEARVMVDVSQGKVNQSLSSSVVEASPASGVYDSKANTGISRTDQNETLVIAATNLGEGNNSYMYDNTTDAKTTDTTVKDNTTSTYDSNGSPNDDNQNSTSSERYLWMSGDDVEIVVQPLRGVFKVTKFKAGGIICQTGDVTSGQAQHCVQNVSVQWSANSVPPVSVRGGTTAPVYLVHITIDLPFEQMAIYTANDTGHWFFPKFPKDVHVFIGANDSDHNGVFTWMVDRSNVTHRDWLPKPEAAGDDDRVHLTWTSERDHHKMIGFQAVNGNETKAWSFCYKRNTPLSSRLSNIYSVAVEFICYFSHVIHLSL